MKKLATGFTLIELMIVVAIIGILAAIAIPTYQDYIARAQMTEALTLASGQKAPVGDVFSQIAACPNNATAAGATSAGLALNTDIKGSYVLKVDTGGTASTSGGCTVIATMRSSGVSSGIAGTTLTLTLTSADKGSLFWTCASSALQKYLPKACIGA
jgi:type IV pilus assembly protein PilA